MSAGPAGPGRPGLGLPGALRPAAHAGAVADRHSTARATRREAARRRSRSLELALAGCGVLGRRAAAAPRRLPKGDFGPTEPGPGERKRPAPPAKQPVGGRRAGAGRRRGRRVGVEGDVGVRPAQLEVSADGTLRAAASGSSWERLGGDRHRDSCACATATRPAPRAASTSSRRSWSSPRPRLCGRDDLLRPRRGLARAARTPPRPTCGRRADHRRHPGGSAAPGDGAGARDARTAGTASGRSARGTSGTSTGWRWRAARPPAPATSTG